MSYNFITVDTLGTTSSFSFKPVNYPLVYNNNEVNADVLTSSISPANLSLIPNTYNVQSDNQATSVWYINASGSNYSGISGSIITGSSYPVTFAPLNSLQQPVISCSIAIEPVLNNVIWSSSFNPSGSSLVLKDTVYYYTNETGSVTVNLLPQLYKIYESGYLKNTNYYIMVTGEGYANQFITPNSFVTQPITPQKQANYVWMAQSSSYSQTASYALNTVPSISSSYALTASYAMNGGSGGVSSSYAATSSFAASASLAVSASFYPSTAQDFTIIQYGDPQYHDPTNYGAPAYANFSASISWIISNKQTLNIAAVVIPGDLVNVYNQNIEWQSFLVQAQRIHNAGIPLILSQGNHDDNGTCLYYNTSASALITSDPTYQSTFTNGTTSRGDVYAQTVNGIKIAYIALSYYGVTDPLLQQWAIETAHQYSDHSVHWLIHGYLNGSGQISTAANDQYYNYGDITWQDVVSQCPNSTIVYCGHIFQTLNGQNDSPWDRSVSVGSANNIIQNLRFDCQATVWYGLQYVRLYQYKPTANVIHASTYDTSQSLWITWNGSTFDMPIKQTFDNYSVPSLLTETIPDLANSGEYDALVSQVNVVQNMTLESITWNSLTACTASLVLLNGYSPTSSYLNCIAISQSINVGPNVFNWTSSGNWFNGSPDVPLSASTNWYANTTKYIGLFLHNGAQTQFQRNNSAYDGNYFDIPQTLYCTGSLTFNFALSPAYTFTYQDGIKDATFSPTLFLDNQVFQMTASNAVTSSLALTASYLLGSIQSASFASSSSYAVTSSYVVSSSYSNQTLSSSNAFFSRNRYEDIDNGLLVYIPFCEGSGSLLNDYGPLGYNLYGSISTLELSSSNLNWTTSSIAGGYSVSFPGTASFNGSGFNPGVAAAAFNTSSNSTISGLNKVSVGIWFNKSSSVAAGDEILVSKTVGGTGGEWFLRLVPGNEIQWSCVTSIGGVLTRNDLTVATLPYSYTDGNWHYLIGTYNSSSKYQAVYLDGQLIGSSSILSGSLNSQPTVGIMVAGFEGNSMWYSGSLDEFKMWNRDLSPTEIKTNWEQYYSGNQPYSDAYGNTVNSGSLNVLGVITGSLNGTSSFAVSSSFASHVLSSSYAATASLLLGTVQSASYAISASWAPTVASNFSVSSSWASQSLWSVSSSFASSSVSASYSITSSYYSSNGSIIYSNAGSGTGIQITPATSTQFRISPQHGYLILSSKGELDLASQQYTYFQWTDSSGNLSVGDVGFSNNGTVLSVNDSLQNITFTAQTVNADSITASLQGTASAVFGNASAVAQDYIVTGSYTYTLNSASYTLVQTDNGRLIQINSTGSTITVPSNLNQGFETNILQLGTGSFVITGSGGVSLNNLSGHSGSAGQFAMVSIVQYNTSSYVLVGGLS